MVALNVVPREITKPYRHRMRVAPGLCWLSAHTTIQINKQLKARKKPSEDVEIESENLFFLFNEMKKREARKMEDYQSPTSIILWCNKLSRIAKWSSSMNSCLCFYYTFRFSKTSSSRSSRKWRIQCHNWNHSKIRRWHTKRPTSIPSKSQSGVWKFHRAKGMCIIAALPTTAPSVSTLHISFRFCAYQSGQRQSHTSSDRCVLRAIWMASKRKKKKK